MSKKQKKLVLIDGNAIIHRAYHALPPLITKKGELVNAVYGFVNLIFRVIKELEPDYIVATFDLKAPTFRHIEYKEYKATRVKAPQELYDQIERVKEMTEALGIPIYEKAGFEADDLIGTIANQSEKSGEDVENIIVTGDLDALQLVSSKTKVYALRKGMSDTVLYDGDRVIKRYGLKPSQMIDYKGLRGDPSDNIPGVKGVGEKTAVTLLQKYGNLEEVYKNISETKGALKEKLERDKMQAFMSKRLATIVKDAPVKLNFEAAVTKEFDRAKLVSLLQELNFFSLIKRIPENASGVYPFKSSQSEDAEGVFDGVKEIKYEKISENKAQSFWEELEKQKPASPADREVAFWLDVNSEKKIEGIAFSWKTGRANYIEKSKEQEEKFKEFFENKSISKVGYDLKEDYKVLKNNGINLYLGDFSAKGESTVGWDIMLSAYSLNPGGKMELAQLVLEELGEEMIEEKKKGQLGLEIESEEDHFKKICQKADYIFKLKNIFADKIKDISQEQNNKQDLNYLFSQLEMPLVEILAEMEMNGVKLNSLIFKGISEKITTRIKSLEKGIYKLAGTEFNINSPKQLQEILFVKLNLPTEAIKKLKTGFSTASGELEKLRGKSKIIEKIEEYREIFKLKTTYLDAIPLLVDENSRIHSSFNQAVTATGRLSSSEPNLQNIPIKTDLGQLLRTAFVAEKDNVLVSADYSQIDLRVVAHVSGDEKMIETFMKGEDVHRATASEVKKIPLSQVSEKIRSEAKALNFGVIYGMSVFGFSQSAGVDREEAKKFINAYMEKFSGIAKYMKDTKEFARQNLYVETEMGRRRNIPEINSPNFQVQNAAERMAINMPIQGLAADIMKLAMIEVYEEFKDDENVKMVLQVHDEIILEVKETEAKKIAKKMKEIMENVYKLKVPLVVDVEIGDNWGEI